MSILPQAFAGFVKDINDRYALALQSAGLVTGGIPLKIEDTTFERAEFKSEFAAISPPPEVRITWNGIASLWACGHAVARLARRMFEAQRKFDASKGNVRLHINDDEQLKNGLYFFDLSLKLAKHRLEKWYPSLPP